MSDAINHNRGFLKYIVLTLLTAIILSVYPLVKFASPEVVTGVISGTVLSFVNALMGYIVVEISFQKSYSVFIQIVLGGIVARLIVMVALLLVLLFGFQLHTLSLVGSLFGMYVVFLVLEVMHINSKWHEQIQKT